MGRAHGIAEGREALVVDLRDARLREAEAHEESARPVQRDGALRVLGPLGREDTRREAEPLGREVHEDEKAAGPQDADDLTKDGSAVLQVVKDVERNGGGERTIRERKGCAVRGREAHTWLLARPLRQGDRDLLVLGAHVDALHHEATARELAGHDAHPGAEVEDRAP